MTSLFFALASADLGVDSNLINIIFAAAGIILIGLPVYFVAKSKGGNKGSFANY